MMLLTTLAPLFLLAMPAQQNALAATAEQEAIIVIGQRLKDVHVRLKEGHYGSFRCSVAQSSGDSRIDQEVSKLTCSIARRCRSSGNDHGQARASCFGRLWDPAIIRLAERLARERETDDAQD